MQAMNGSPDEPRGHDVEGPPRETNRLVKKIKLLNRFVDGTIIGLEPFTSLLWVVLYREARDGFAALSHEQIATKMGVSARTVARHIDILIANRLLRKVKTGGFGRGCNRYQLGIEDKSADNPLRRLPRVKKRDSPAEPNPPTRRKPK